MVNRADRSPADGADASQAHETVDTLFGGRLRLHQSRRGYRFSLDAVLLAHFAKSRGGETVADLGSGNGVVALMLAYLYPSLNIMALEVQASLAACAARNCRLNGLESRVTVLAGDVRNIDTLVEREGCDLVICNPPFRKPSSGRVSPDEERKIARHEIRGTLDDFLRAGRYLLRVKGRMALIFPAVRSVDLLESMRKAGIEPKRLRMVYSYANAQASLILVEGVKGGRGAIEVMAPLVVYEAGKGYTPEVVRMLRGDGKQTRRPGDLETRRLGE